ncbi:MAG: FkbM family methyltransferase, partial [Burkholderiales bacterium]|nr:FkbM family methyltransferase [Burkholderiales bacterium]
IGRSIETYGEFSEFEVDLFRQILSVGDNVVEVGSNYGTHTLPLARIVGPGGFVHAVEAQRIVSQALCATISLNNLENVACYQVAAAAATGHFFIPQFSYALEQNYGGMEIDREASGERVSAVKLDDLITVSTLRLIKIDAEGMEQQVLAGAVRLIDQHRPLLYVENDRAAKSPALIRAIAGLGYRLYWHIPPMFNPNNFAGNPENIFGGTCSINMLCLPREAHFAMDEFVEILDYDAHPLLSALRPDEKTG